MGVVVQANDCFFAHDLYSLQRVLHVYSKKKVQVIGSGSNILFTKNITGLLIKMHIKGIYVLKKQAGYVYLKVGAGVLWHDLVCFCLYRNYGGIENLILIPGTVGAAPIQNIGAYGVSLSDTMVALTAIHIESGRLKIFSKAACDFGYRQSFFKKNQSQYIITDVTFRLTLPIKHQLHTQYGIIQHTLNQMSLQNPTIQSVGNAIMHIRKTKLPDPQKIGNVGSFFQNPMVSQKKYRRLKKKNPNLIAYAIDAQHVKLSAAWLIEACGWKKKVVNKVGLYDKHALVLVNHGGATGKSIKAFAQTIQEDVKKKMTVDLKFEVNIW